MKKKMLVTLIAITVLLSSSASAYISGPEDGQFLLIQNSSAFICCCGPLEGQYPPPD